MNNDLIADYWTAPTPPVSPTEWQSVYENKGEIALETLL